MTSVLFKWKQYGGGKMRSILDKKILKISTWDWLLVFGVMLAPMNALRIWKVGPAEVLCLLWSIRQFKAVREIKFSDYMMRFWGLFMVTITLGAIYGDAHYGSQSNISGLLTYCYFVVISLGVYAGIRNMKCDCAETLLQAICVVPSMWYMFLYVYSKTVSKTFLGAPLWYYSVRFSAGANNPHQVALVVSALAFGNLRFLLRKELSRAQRLLHAVCSVFCLFVGMKTRSSTLIVALAVTAAMLISWYAFLFFKAKNLKISAKSMRVALAAVAVIAIVLCKPVYDFAYQWIASDPNGLGRFSIFSTITDSLKKSFWIGLGPGTHGRGGEIEYHNMYLEILAMGGIIGLGIFLAFSWRLCKKLRHEPMLAVLVIPLYAYGLAGFAMRRLVFWVLVPFAAALSAKYYRQDKGRLDEKRRMSSR